MEEHKPNSLEKQLDRLLKLSETQDLSIQTILNTLAGRGHAILLILFSLPFCQPIQIPGFSTIFGIVLGFIGLRIAFGHRAWLPQKILEKKIAHTTLKKAAAFTIKIVGKLQFLISTRWTWLVQNHLLRVVHGLTIAFLSLILALPLPIPFTNLLAASPILAFGLAMLEDDGVFIVVAYLLTFLCILSFLALFIFGKEWLSLKSIS